MISFTTSIFAAKKTGIFDELDDDAHLDCNSICIAFLMVYYVIYNGLFNARYLENLLIRQVFFIANIVCLLLWRRQFESSHESGLPIIQGICCFFGIIIIEIILYMKLKESAKLFLAEKVAEKLQDQLLTLLNQVPDRVLICKDPQEGEDPQCVFSNRNMNQFFGKSPVQQH